MVSLMMVDNNKETNLNINSAYLNDDFFKSYSSPVAEGGVPSLTPGT